MMAARPAVTRAIPATAFPRLETIFGDNKYHNHDLQAWMATHRPTWRLPARLVQKARTALRPCGNALGGGTHQRLERSGS